MGKPTAIKPEMYGCCSVNGANSLYYAWHGITRFDEGVATVNLFLNRASAWMDIDSYLPYEGKVVLHNKLARLARVPHPFLGRDLARCGAVSIKNKSHQRSAATTCFSRT